MIAPRKSLEMWKTWEIIKEIIDKNNNSKQIS